jgi:hypothetical protein
VRFNYNNPEDSLKTHEEAGFRISDHDANLRFPTDETWDSLVKRLNEFAEGHVLKACPGGSECEICFFVKAATESNALNKYIQKLGTGMLGPIFMTLVEYNTFFTVMVFMLFIGMESGKAKTPDAVKSEVDALKNLFLMPEKTNPEMEDKS